MDAELTDPLGRLSPLYDLGTELTIRPRGGGTGSNIKDSDIAETLANRPDLFGTSQKQAVDDAVNTARGIRAYHGSPHEFEKFESSKIGTGEGAQAFGHGLYFAEAEPVAKGYRDALSGNAPQLKVDGRTLSSLHMSSDIDDLIKKKVGLAYHQFNDLDKAIDYVSQQIEGKMTSKFAHPLEVESYKNDLIKLENLRQNKPTIEPHTGYMYEVNINANPEHFLDWDKPLIEQNETIRRMAGLTKEYEDVLRQARKQDTDNLLSALEGNNDYRPVKMPQRPKGSLPHDMTGEDFHEHLANKMGAIDWPSYADKTTRANYRSEAAKKVADFLSNNGIKGVKYLDRQSRKEGEGSRNYVVFDPKDIEIMRRYARGGDVRHGYAVKGAVKDDEPVGDPAGLIPMQRPEDPADAIMRKMVIIPEALSGLGEEVVMPGFPRPTPLGAAAVNAGMNAALRVIPPTPLNEAALRTIRLEDLAKAQGMTPRVLGERFSKIATQSTPYEEWEYTYRPGQELLPRKTFDVNQLKTGDIIYPLVGDITNAGRVKTSILGKNVDVPMEEGGPNYMRANPGKVWASGEGVVGGIESGIKNALDVARKIKNADPSVYGMTVAMRGDSGDFSTHTADAILGMLPSAKITKDAAKKFDEFMRQPWGKNYPATEDWPGIKSPKLKEYLDAPMMGEVRKKFAKGMDTADFRDLGFPSVGAARFSTIDPDIAHLPSETTGYAIGKFSPENFVNHAPSVAHRSYPSEMLGNYEGGLAVPLMRDDIFQSFSKAYDKQAAEKKIPENRLVNAKKRAFGMKSDAYQIVDPQYQDYLGKLIEQRIKEGRAKGGRSLGNNAIDNALRMARGHFGFGGADRDAAEGSTYSGNVSHETPSSGGSSSPSNDGGGNGPWGGNSDRNGPSGGGNDRSSPTNDPVREAIEKELPNKMTGVEGATPIGMPTSMKELMNASGAAKAAQEQQQQQQDQDLSKALGLAKSSFFSPDGNMMGFNVNPSGPSMANINSVVGVTDPTKFSGKEDIGLVGGENADPMRSYQTAEQALQRAAMTSPKTSDIFSQAESDRLMSGFPSTNVAQATTPSANQPTVDRAMVFDPVAQGFVPVGSASPQAMALARRENVFPSSSATTVASVQPSVVSPSPTDASIYGYTPPASVAPVASVASVSPTVSDALMYGYNPPAGIAPVASVNPVAPISSVAPTSTMASIYNYTPPASFTPTSSAVGTTTAPASTTATTSPTVVAENVPFPPTVVRDPIKAAVAAAKAPIDPALLGGVDLAARKAAPTVAGVSSSGVPMPTPRPDELKSEPNFMSQIIDSIKSDLAFKEGERINALEAAGKTATFPGYSSASDPTAASREYARAIGLNPDNPEDMAKVQARIIQQDGQDKVDYYTKTLGEALFGPLADMFGKKTGAPSEVMPSSGGGGGGGGGGDTGGSSVKAGPGRKILYPYQTELGESAGIPSLDGRSAQEWANAHADGDLSRVHGSLDWSTGAPRVVYHL